MPLAAGNCEVVNALRKLSKRFKLWCVVYFVDLPEALAIENDLVSVQIEQADSNVFIGSAVDKVFEDTDIRWVGCFDLVEQGISTCFGSDVPGKYPGQVGDGAQVSS